MIITSAAPAEDQAIYSDERDAFDSDLDPDFDSDSDLDENARLNQALQATPDSTLENRR